MSEREIKFRAWNKSQNGFIAGFNMFNYHGYYNENLEPSIKRYGSEWKASEIILMQYTGLKDKNGREIYEGDVAIRTINYGKTIEKGVIVFASSEAYFGFRRYRQDGTTKITSIGIDATKLEVIGNIYENPELMATDNA